MKPIVAVAHPNIALVKYWGKRDAALNIPAAGSLSITLDAFTTRTTVERRADMAADDICLNGQHAGTERLAAFVDLVRARAGVGDHFRIRTENDFPTAAGLASSASGFAALAVALDCATGLHASSAELSALARRGSGSAARSLFGGFAQMAAGRTADGSDAMAQPLLPAASWPLTVAIAITARTPKDISSRDGMDHTAATSPYYSAWVATTTADLAAARAAVLARDFERLAALAEANCLAMHAAVLAARPGLLYWNGASVECMHAVRSLRARGTAAFFTVDAGPQVKVVCLPEAIDEVFGALQAIPGVEQVVRSGLGGGARVVQD